MGAAPTPQKINAISITLICIGNITWIDLSWQTNQQVATICHTIPDNLCIKIGCFLFIQLNLMKAFLAASLLLLSTNLWAATIVIEDAYVRHMPPTQSVSGAFMVFKNTTSSDRAVVSAESNVADKVELHAHVHEGGMMKMRQVEKIDIPADGETILKPGGFHVMLIGLKQPLDLGQIVEIKFDFDDGSSQQIQAEVKSVMAGMKMQDDAMEHKEMDHSKMKTMQN